MKLKFPVGVVAAAALLAAAAWAAPAHAGSVRGTVRDQATLAPLVGAWVTVSVVDPDSLDLSAPTDGDGHYEILGIPSGDAHYVVSAAAANHSLSYASLPSLGTSDLTYDILLPLLPPPPPPGNPDSTFVTGTVLAPSGSSLLPLSGAGVSLTSGGSSFTLTTDAQGHYKVMVPSGQYAARVSASGFQSLDFPSVQVAGTSFVLDAALQSTVGVPPGPLAGFVLLGATPHPVRGAGAVAFALPVASRVSLRLYDVAGRLRATLFEGVSPAGMRSARLDAAELASGVYMTRMVAAPVGGGAVFRATRSIVVMR